MEELLCFLDMDGVLADFVTGVCKAHNRPSPYSMPSSYGIWEMEELWEVSLDEFWKPTQVDGFWANLGKMDQADELVAWACDTFGVKNVGILTHPSEDWRCIPEKKAWMRKHYPQLQDQMLFGGAKRLLAGPNRILIDDRDKNVDSFIQSGGIGITYPQLWNREWKQDDPLAYTQAMVEMATGKAAWQN